MARQCEVVFSIDSIHINFQRNKSDPDNDLVTLTAAGTHRLDDSTTVGPISIGTPSTGASIGPPLDPPIQTTQAFTLTDTDNVVMTCRISNGSHSDAAHNRANMLAVAGAFSALLGAGEQLAQKLEFLKGHSELELLMLQGLTIGAFIGLLGEIASDFGVQLGLEEPDCDGPVFDSVNAGLINLGGPALMDALEQGRRNLISHS